MSAEFAALDQRGVIRHSIRLKVVDDRLGHYGPHVAPMPNEKLGHLWKSLADGETGADLSRREDARRRTRTPDFDDLSQIELPAPSQDTRSKQP